MPSCFTSPSQRRRFRLTCKSQIGTVQPFEKKRVNLLLMKSPLASWGFWNVLLSACFLVIEKRLFAEAARGREGGLGWEDAGRRFAHVGSDSHIGCPQVLWDKSESLSQGLDGST